MSKHTSNTPKSSARATPMTREGVADPSLLSADGQKAHATRFSGPGTRSKNPRRFDNNDRGRSVPLGDGTTGSLKKVRTKLDARIKAWDATIKADYAKSAKGQRKPGSMQSK